MQKITPFLWFDHQAEQAAEYYVSLFKHSKITHVSRYPEGGPQPKGLAMTVNFQLEGVDFIALNGGPHYKLTSAFSLFVDCKTQAEVDALYGKLSEGGEKQPCGWLTDRFGLSWQIIPEALGKMLGDPNPKKAGRAMEAMMQMKCIDIARLEQAYNAA